MITTKEIYLNFNKGIATATININHLVKKITIISIAVNENTYMVSYCHGCWSGWYVRTTPCGFLACW